MRNGREDEACEEVESRPAGVSGPRYCTGAILEASKERGGDLGDVTSTLGGEVVREGGSKAF